MIININHDLRKFNKRKYNDEISSVCSDDSNETRHKKIRLEKQKQKQKEYENNDENDDIIIDWQQEQRVIQENYLEMLNKYLHNKFRYTNELREGITLDNINDTMQEYDYCQEHLII